LLKSQVLSSERNTERVREDASGDSEDGEDDEYNGDFKILIRSWKLEFIRRRSTHLAKNSLERLARDVGRPQVAP